MVKVIHTVTLGPREIALAINEWVKKNVCRDFVPIEYTDRAVMYQMERAQCCFNIECVARRDAELE